MTEPYLILHKVRGDPAFDIAEKLTVGDEEGWIIPTSGHRAYPIRHWKLDDLVDGSDCGSFHPMDLLNYDEAPALIADLPDHYTVTVERRTKLTGLLEKLGLSKPKVNLGVRPL